jgi:hypothetical protein
MGNVTIWQDASLESSMMAGICHMDTCLGSANRSRRPPCATGRPRSQGFFNAHSEPASVAAVKIAHVRSTSKSASLSFLRNLGGQFGTRVCKLERLVTDFRQGVLKKICL